MTKRLIDLDGTIVPCAADDSPVLGARVSALVGARIVDEITGRPPVAEIIVRGDIVAAPRAGAGGIVGLAGVPRDVFPALGIKPYSVTLTIAAEGFVSRTVPIEVPQDVAFPTTYAPPPFLDWDFHRKPVVIEGRVVHAAGGGTTPLAGANVRVTGVWRQAPTASAVVPAEPPNLVALDPPLQVERTAASGALTPLALTAVPGDLKTILDDVQVGTSRIRLSNARGIVIPGTRVAIDADDVDRLEYGDVVALEAATTTDQPAWITLALPVIGSHRNGAAVRRVTAGPAGAPRAVARDALPGDAVLFVATVAGLATGATVRVADGTPPNEYHRVALFDVVTNSAGYYRLPPLARVAQLAVRAQSGALAPVDVELRPDYTQPRQRLDFVLT